MPALISLESKAEAYNWHKVGGSEGPRSVRTGRRTIHIGDCARHKPSFETGSRVGELFEDKKVQWMLILACPSPFYRNASRPKFINTSRRVSHTVSENSSSCTMPDWEEYLKSHKTKRDAKSDKSAATQSQESLATLPTYYTRDPGGDEVKFFPVLDLDRTVYDSTSRVDLGECGPNHRVLP